MSETAIRAGTRGSPLALLQTRDFLRLLAAVPNAGDSREVIIATTGDAVQDRPWPTSAAKACSPRKSTKPCWTTASTAPSTASRTWKPTFPPGLCLAACWRGRMPAMSSILGEACGHATARQTRWPRCRTPRWSAPPRSAARRSCCMLGRTCASSPIRGNVQTRLRKLRDGECQASNAGPGRTAPAWAWTSREPSSSTRRRCLPAAAQGIVGITIRADDSALQDVVRQIEDPTSRAVATAERALLAALDGSCRTPIGAHASLLAGWQPDPDRPDCPGRRVVPVAALGNRRRNGRRPYRRRPRRQPPRSMLPPICSADGNRFRRPRRCISPATTGAL